MRLNREEILEFLPHRPPFLFTDSVEIILPKDFGARKCKDKINLRAVKDTQIISSLHVQKDGDIFQGHFPGNPILPGVIQIEIMAQASLFTAYGIVKNLSKKINVLLAGISNAKFRKPILPGTDLRAEVKCWGVKGPFIFSKGLIMVEEKNVAECEIIGLVEIVKGGPS